MTDSLRGKLIRLAHVNKDLRPHLLPLLRRVTADTVINKLPPGSEAKGFENWGSWGGDLAMVEKPWWSSSGTADSSDFNPDNMTRRYLVRFALTLDKRSKIPADRTNLGYPVVVRDRSANYEKTTWTVGNPGYGPTQTGTFGPSHTFWVKIKLKELWPPEVRAVTTKLDREGYYDVTGSQYTLPMSTWKKILKMSFEQVQDLDSKISNAAYGVVSDPWSSATEEQEAKAWRDLKGVFRLNKKRDKFMWIVGR